MTANEQRLLAKASRAVLIANEGIDKILDMLCDEAADFTDSQRAHALELLATTSLARAVRFGELARRLLGWRDKEIEEYENDATELGLVGIDDYEDCWIGKRGTK